MPIYEYLCTENKTRIEVLHGIDERVTTWGRLCELAGAALGDTAPDAPVTKVISAPSLAFPKTNTELKNMGFTKLVKRDKGVYENVTAAEGESRFMTSDNPNSMPNFTNKISD